MSREDIACVPPFVREHMLQEHLKASKVGKLAAQAKVGTVVPSQLRKIAQADGDETRGRSQATWWRGTDPENF